jgi:hypothetical protein
MRERALRSIRFCFDQNPPHFLFVQSKLIDLNASRLYVCRNMDAPAQVLKYFRSRRLPFCLVFVFSCPKFFQRSKSLLES